MQRRPLVNPLAVYAVFFVVLLYGPVMLLPAFSLNDSIYIAFPFKGFTTKWYYEMATSRPLINALVSSMKVGIPVAIISTALGLLAAKALTRYRLPGRQVIMGLLMIPLVVPFIVLGVGNLVVLRKVFDIDLSLWTIGAGHVMICTPFSILVLISRLEGFDKSLEEASFDLGEGAWRTFWRVTFPLAVPGIISSFLLCFSTSFDEFVLAFFLSGTEPTLPIYMYSLLRFPSKVPGALALASCILMGSIVVIVFAEWYRRRGIQAQQEGLI